MLPLKVIVLFFFITEASQFTASQTVFEDRTHNSIDKLVDTVASKVVDHLFSRAIKPSLAHQAGLDHATLGKPLHRRSSTSLPPRTMAKTVSKPTKTAGLGTRLWNAMGFGHKRETANIDGKGADFDDVDKAISVVAPFLDVGSFQQDANEHMDIVEGHLEPAPILAVDPTSEVGMPVEVLENSEQAVKSSKGVDVTGVTPVQILQSIVEGDQASAVDSAEDKGSHRAESKSLVDSAEEVIEEELQSKLAQALRKAASAAVASQDGSVTSNPISPFMEKFKQMDQSIEEQVQVLREKAASQEADEDIAESKEQGEIYASDSSRHASSPSRISKKLKKTRKAWKSPSLKSTVHRVVHVQEIPIVHVKHIRDSPMKVDYRPMQRMAAAAVQYPAAPPDDSDSASLPVFDEAAEKGSQERQDPLSPKPVQMIPDTPETSIVQDSTSGPSGTNQSAS